MFVERVSLNSKEEERLSTFEHTLKEQFGNKVSQTALLRSKLTEIEGNIKDRARENQGIVACILSRKVRIHV